MKWTVMVKMWKMCARLPTAIYLVGCLLILALLTGVQGTEYDMVVENEQIFTPCEAYPDDFLSNHFDMSDLHFEFEDNDMVHCYGKFVLTKQYDQEVPIHMDAQVYRKSRGEWVDTLYNMRRTDFCPGLYDQNEIWYRYTALVPEDERVCPPPQNFTIELDTEFALRLDLPDRNAEGEYKVQVKLGQGSEFVCFEIYANAYKV